MVMLICVKLTNVLLISKMFGDLKCVHLIIHKSIVNVHSKLLNKTLVMVLGIVMISSLSLLMLSTPLIPTMMVLSILKMILIQNI